MIALPTHALATVARLLNHPTSRRHGPVVLRWVARARVPIVGSDSFARQETAYTGAVELARVGPFVTEFAPPDSPRLDGPLGGEAVAVKDSVDIAGEWTGQGLVEGSHMATADALLITRLKAAGGWVIGKTKMTELGMDGLGAVMPYAIPDNPRAPGHFAGGSSTGTAVAVARGLARYGIGADGLGSVRIPAGYCGLVGLKPGLDALPTHGLTSVSPSMDMPGPMARTAADCARLWQVLADEPVRALSAQLPTRVGLIRELGPDLACASIRTAFWRVLAALGLPTTQVSIPGAEHATFLGAAVATAEMVLHPLAQRPLTPAGQLNVAVGEILNRLERSNLGPFDSQRAAIIEATERALDVAPLLLMPTTPIPAPAVTDALLTGAQNGLLMRAIGGYTPLANLTRLPAIAVPCGVDHRGRPLSIMAMGPQGSETQLLRFALAVEATGLGETPV